MNDENKIKNTAQEEVAPQFANADDAGKNAGDGRSKPRINELFIAPEDKEVQKFSDFMDENDNALPGKKIRAAECMNRNIVIRGYRIFPSKHRDNSTCLALQIEMKEEMDGGKRVLFTGSRVLQDQIRKYKDHLPFETKITKTGDWMSFAA
jgi:hypothetical protein